MRYSPKDSAAILPGKKGVHSLTSPWGREIDALVFVRSYQETEKTKHKSVINALNAVDPDWKTRELIVMPSHVGSSRGDVKQMISAAHDAGFDAVCASVIFTGVSGNNPSQVSRIWRQNWDERWTVPNRHHDTIKKKKLDGQLQALGCDLWTWVCRAIAS